MDLNFIHIFKIFFTILPNILYIASFIASLLFQDMRGILFVSGGIIVVTYLSIFFLQFYVILRFLSASL